MCVMAIMRTHLHTCPVSSLILNLDIYAVMETVLCVSDASSRSEVYVSIQALPDYECNACMVYFNWNTWSPSKSKPLQHI